MNRPAMAPAKGSVIELAQTVGQSWISPFSGELTPESLRSCLDTVQRYERNRQAPLDRFDPATISRATAAALSETLAGKRVPAPSSEIRSEIQ